MPAQTVLHKKVRDVVARNVINEGKFVLVNCAKDPLLVIESGLSVDEWGSVLDAILSHLKLKTPQLTLAVEAALLGEEKRKEVVP